MFRIGHVIHDGSAGPARADPAGARRVSGCRDHARADSARRWSVASATHAEDLFRPGGIETASIEERTVEDVYIRFSYVRVGDMR